MGIDGGFWPELRSISHHTKLAQLERFAGRLVAGLDISGLTV